MKRKTPYPIPNYPRYVIYLPFQIVDESTGLELKQFTSKTGARRVHLYDREGKRRTISVITLAALAFRGLQPAGYVAHHTGGDISPTTVFWITEREALRIRRMGITEWQRMEISEDYFENNLTQDRIAKKYGISQASVSRFLRMRKGIAS